MPPSESDIVEEQIHFSNVVTTFEQYGPYSLAANNRRRKDLYSLSLADQEILKGIKWNEKIALADTAIRKNAALLKRVVAEPEIFMNAHLDEEGEDEGDQDDATMTGQSLAGSTAHHHGQSGHSHSHSHDGPSSHTHDVPSTNSNLRKRYRPTDFDMDKLRSTLKQMVRDWSEEGEEERYACYEPMKDALERHFANVPHSERGKLRVLVPGSGLGRLAFEVARMGFSSQANEFSHYMLLVSHFILNRTKEIHEHEIFPYVHSFSNLPNRAALLRPVKVPDVLPSDLPPNSDFSLVAGDFEEVYGADGNEEPGSEPQSGKWDAILTCFFLDTAKNVVNYLRIIRRILAPGGVWINLGPLLWHWENNTSNDPSIELDLLEVKELCSKLGFILANERSIDTSYTSNMHTMLGYVYNAAFWTATLDPNYVDPATRGKEET